MKPFFVISVNLYLCLFVDFYIIAGKPILRNRNILLDIHNAITWQGFFSKICRIALKLVYYKHCIERFESDTRHKTRNEM